MKQTLNLGGANFTPGGKLYTWGQTRVVENWPRCALVPRRSRLPMFSLLRRDRSRPGVGSLGRARHSCSARFLRGQCYI
jgi:hypothetical protein